MQNFAGAVAPIFFVLRNTEEWLVRGISRISVIVDDDEKRTLRRIKAIVELLFWELYVVRTPSTCLLKELIESLSQANRNGELAYFFWKHTETDTLARVCLGMMIELGIASRADPIIRSTLFLLDHSYHEQLPFRSLDVEHARWKFFTKGRKPSAFFIAAKRFSGDRIPRTISDEYALTHTIFYLTDFGADPELLSQKSPGLRERIFSLCAEALNTNNLDILSEHILCIEFLGGDFVDHDVYANELLSRVHSEGYWPGPLALDEELRTEGFNDGEATFFENYHTTLLARDVLQRISLAKNYALSDCSLEPHLRVARHHRCLPGFAAKRSSATSGMRKDADRQAYIKLLSHGSIDEDLVIQHLMRPGCIQFSLLGLARRSHRACSKKPVSDFPNLCIALRYLADVRADLTMPNLFLTRSLAGYALNDSGSALPASNGIGEVLLVQLENAYRELSMSKCRDNFEASKKLSVAVEILCIASIFFAGNQVQITAMWRIALNGALHQAVRSRDVVSMSYLLWCNELLGIPVELSVHKMGKNTVEVYRELVRKNREIEGDSMQTLGRAADTCWHLLLNLERIRKTLLGRFQGRSATNDDTPRNRQVMT